MVRKPYLERIVSPQFVVTVPVGHPRIRIQAKKWGQKYRLVLSVCSRGQALPSASFCPHLFTRNSARFRHLAFVLQHFTPAVPNGPCEELTPLPRSNPIFLPPSFCQKSCPPSAFQASMVRFLRANQPEEHVAGGRNGNLVCSAGGTHGVGIGDPIGGGKIGILLQTKSCG
jgi:hypothetical protein